MTATNSAEPLINQTTGKLLPPRETINNPGTPDFRAGHIPGWP
jgi:hypothetical protein